MQYASREPLEGAAALSALEGIAELYVAKGRKSIFLDLTRDRPSDDKLLELLLGRSGKLRAPTLRIGKRLIVGYHVELLEDTGDLKVSEGGQMEATGNANYRQWIQELGT